MDVVGRNAETVFRGPAVPARQAWAKQHLDGVPHHADVEHGDQVDPLFRRPLLVDLGDVLGQSIQ